MEFLCDNCIREIKFPKATISTFDYNSELNLIAHNNDAFDYDGNSLTIWNPDTMEVVRRINLEITRVRSNPCDVVFLPDNIKVAVSWTQGYGRRNQFYDEVFVHSIASPLEGPEENQSCKVFTSQWHQEPLNIPLVLTPQNNLLVGTGDSVVNLGLDSKMNVLKDVQTIYKLPNVSDMWRMCCSRSGYDVCLCDWVLAEQFNLLRSLHLDIALDGKLQVAREEIVTHCYINGERREFDCVKALAHDGENFIVGTADAIIVLESATNGSIGHVIESMGIGEGQIRVKCEGQIMVSNGHDVIKVYEYKRPKTLQGLCHRQINKILNYRQDKVVDLPINKIAKDYLLYKTN